MTNGVGFTTKSPLTKTLKKILIELFSRESISISELNKLVNISNRCIRNNLIKLINNNLISIAIDIDDLRKRIIRLKRS
jgi:predicted ArsR family transcriptional regulator